MGGSNLTSEANIQRLGMMRASRLGAVTIRNNVGAAWVAPPNRQKKFNKDGKLYVTLEQPMWLDYGLGEGSADTVGWKSVTVTQDMVGKKLAVFTSIEYKTAKGRAKEKQVNWHNAMKQAGAYSGFVRCEDDVDLILSGVYIEP